MKKIYTLFFIALMGVSQVWANSASSANNSESVANNKITIPGNHAIFYISGSSISYHEGITEYFNSYSFGEIAKKSSREYSITWQANAGLSIAVTDISFKLRAYNGSAGFDTGSAKVQFNGITTSVGTIWVAEVDEKSFFTIKGSGNFTSGVTFKCDNTSSIYKFEYLIKDIIITYTITPDKPGLKETMASVQVTLDDADKKTINLADYFTVSDESDYRPLVGYNKSGGIIEGDNFYAKAVGTYTVNAYIGAKDNCHVKSGNSSDLTITVNKAPEVEVDTLLSFCKGSSVSFREKTYSEAGADQYVAEGSLRDTIFNITIKELQPTSSSEDRTITVGDAGEWNGYDLSTYAPGKYELTYDATNVEGCDSTATLNLKVNKIEKLKVPVSGSFCKGSSFEYRGTEYSEGKTYEIEVPGETRDTLFVLTVTELQPTTGTDEKTITVGAEESWNGIDLSGYAVGIYDDIVFNTTNVAGCDSIVTLTLTVKEKEDQGGTTGFENIRHSEADVQKFFRNGVMYIRRGERIYGLDGRKVE